MQHTCTSFFNPSPLPRCSFPSVTTSRGLVATIHCSTCRRQAAAVLDTLPTLLSKQDEELLVRYSPILISIDIFHQFGNNRVAIAGAALVPEDGA